MVAPSSFDPDLSPRDADVVDLYGGPGGWSVALRILGLVEYGVEWDAAACETARAAGHHRAQMDVRDFPCDSAPRGKVSSPPCQSFSAAGKGAGRRVLAELVRAVGLVGGGMLPAEALGVVGCPDLDERSALVLEPLRVIVGSRPVWIAMEQVTPVLPIWEAYAEVLRSMGYSVDTGILHAEQYGVPQTRRRAFLVANREQEVRLPEPTHSKYYPRSPGRLDEGVLPWVSMADALSWGLADRPAPTVTGGGTETGGAEPIAHLSRYTDRPGWAYRGNQRPDGKAYQVRRLDSPAPCITHNSGSCHWVPEPAVPGDTSWVEVRPSPTIVGSFAPDVVAAPGYRKPGDPPRQKTPGSVRVTVEEAAVLQSFPPDYPWHGSKTAQYRQVGDAVPPLLAYHVLRAATGLGGDR